MTISQLSPPDTGRPCLDLVATIRGRLGEAPLDELASPDRVAGWLSAAGRATARPVTPAQARRFRALREAVFRLAAAAGGTGAAAPGPGDIALVNDEARRDGPPPAELRAVPARDGGGLAATARPPTADQVLTFLARDAIELLAGPDIGRLRQCEAGSCGTFFLDTSRAGRRRWCSSSSCGNRSRVAAHRERQAGP
jgi:predicted RNA-binding Zn ribbon-like protein